jgi:phosphotransferase system  glucose/maltose/N-acetylglucosamine-specific IIC component
MKRALQLLLIVSAVVSVAALSGLVMVCIGYSMAEAFNSTIIKTPQSFEVERQIWLWSIYLLIALSVTFTLFAIYRQNYGRK